MSQGMNDIKQSKGREEQVTMGKYAVSRLSKHYLVFSGSGN